jgi:hypothetical protein
MDKKENNLKMGIPFIPSHLLSAKQEETNDEQEEENPTAFSLLSKIEDPYYSKTSPSDVHQSEGNLA